MTRKPVSPFPHPSRGPHFPVIVGQTLEIKIERIFHGEGVGHTKHGISVYIEGEKEELIIGKVVKVLIMEVMPTVNGTLIPDKVWRQDKREITNETR